MAAERNVDIKAEMPALLHFSDPLPILPLLHDEWRQVLRAIAQRHNLPLVVSEHVVQLHHCDFVQAYRNWSMNVRGENHNGATANHVLYTLCYKFLITKYCIFVLINFNTF